MLQEAIATITEYSEAAITVRGSYFLPGKTVRHAQLIVSCMRGTPG